MKRRGIVLLLLVLCMMPVQTKAVPSDATQTILVSIEVYWAITAGGFGDWPEENEWTVLYQGQDILFEENDQGVYLFVKLNGTINIDYHKWIETSIHVVYKDGSASTNTSQNSNIMGIRTERLNVYYDNFVTSTICVNNTEGEYFYNRRIFEIHFGDEPATTTSTTSTTTITTSTTTSTTSTTTTTSNTGGSGTTLTISPELGFVLILFLGIIGLAAIMKRGKETPTDETIPPISPEVKVLIICPYCGARNEQGILKCRNCQADI